MLLVCILAILTSAGSLVTSRVLIASMTRVETGAGLALGEARAVQLVGVRNIADAHACLLSSGSRFAPAARASAVRVREQATRMRAATTDSMGRALLDSVLTAERAHENAFMLVLGTSGVAGAEGAGRFSGVVLSQGVRFDAALTAMVNYFEAARLRSLADSRADVNRAETVLVFITIATIALLAILCLLLVGVLGRSYRLQTTARTDAEHGQSQAQASLTEAEATSHLKDEFLATVSHELRNPLAPILTWTQLLRSGTLDEVKTRRALEVIERNVISQSQLIDDLVDVSRVVSGKFRLDVRPIDLVTVIRAAADAQGPASDAKLIRMQLVLDERAGMVSGDSERIQQVMSNLISNAIKFTPKGGKVQVVLQRAESHLEVVVSDSGIGIDAAFLPHVFEPFRQGTGGSMRRHGGLGLGLSIVRHIVELHGGEIAAQSAGLNQGAKFTVKFPLLVTTRTVGEPLRRHPTARDTLADIRPGRLDGLRVLIVDDEPNAGEALMALFESCGAEARVACSASDALELFDVWRPDIMVSDIAMPGEDGYSLIRKIRQRVPQQGGAIPAVALTAYAKIEDRVSILGAGFQMYLSKPADPTELVAVVGSLARDRGPGAPVATP